LDGFAALVTVVAFATSVISGVFGMAGGMILMGVYAAALPVQVAMILHGVTQLFANGFRAFLLRDRIYTATLLWYALGALLAFGFFTWLALVVARPVLFLLLGGIPLTLSIVPKRLAPRFEDPRSALFCGALVTAAHLLAGVSGPLLDVFFVRATQLDRFEVIATKAVTQTAGHAMKIIYFALLVPGPTVEMAIPLWLYPTLVACAYFGTKVGGRILESLSDQNFRSWTARIVVGLSLLYVLRGFAELDLSTPW
jgi:uncharacterized membrane protein YfcA